MPEAARELHVERVGAQVLVQDLGRPGLAHLGVPRSGALDAPALRLANRLVGNPEGHAALECLGGALRVRLGTATTLAVTGARVPLTVDGRVRDWGRGVPVPRGAIVELGPAERGLRAYLAVAGGLAVADVLGSRSTDVLSGLGPPPVQEGDVLPLGAPGEVPVAVDVDTAPREQPGSGLPPALELVLGPRHDWFTRGALAGLEDATYVVSSDSNRVGLRLEGPALRRKRSRQGELASEGMVLGAVQVPPSGQPVVFLADHPTTGGYPVLGVVSAESVALCAQLRPGDEVRLRVVTPDR